MQAAQQAINQQSSQQQSNAQALVATQSSSNTESKQEVPYWCRGANLCQIMAAMTGQEVSLVQLDELKNWLILDSASSEHVVCNTKLVDKTWQSDSELALATNGGPFVSSTKGNIPGCCETWVEVGSMTNILSLAKLSDTFRITMDTAVKNAFQVHTPHGILKFKRGEGSNIYYANLETFAGRARQGNDAPSQNVNIGHAVSHPHCQFIETVKENARFYTPRQRERAREARRFLHLVACPTTSDLKNMITTNFISDCPVTHDDVNIAEDIYGFDRGSKRGKETRSRPNVVVEDYVEVPKELVEKHDEHHPIFGYDVR